jgi:hypothetical protein
MSINLINIGNVVNDGLGDNLRTAFEKVNANFSELETLLSTKATNIGNGVKILVEPTSSNAQLQFKSLLQGPGIVLIDRTVGIEIKSVNPEGSFSKIETDSIAVEALVFPEIALRGGDDISVDGFGATITVDTKKINEKSFREILTTYDFGTFTGGFENAVQFAVALSNADFGTITNPTSLNLDFGPIVQE